MSILMRMRMAPDPTTRNNDRAATTIATPHHYTMKTSSRPPLISSHSHSLSLSRHSQANIQSFRANRTTTPLASPCPPHSVGQPYPPSTKASPAVPEVRSPSPNYFGLNVEDSTADVRDSAVAPLDHWSPPSSSVKSFGAAIPKQVPLDANPEFEAFRRQVDANRAKGFNLGSAHFATIQSPLSTRPRPLRLPTNHSDNVSEISSTRPSSSKALDGAGARMDVDTDSLHDSAYVSSDSKRNSEVSLNTPSFSHLPRFESPAQVDSPFEPIRKTTTLSKADDRHPRLSLPQEKTEQLTESGKPRAETVPATLDGTPGLLLPSQLGEMLQNTPEDSILLLDVRVSTQYAQSRIRGALNLCIPTTLLKRATFNLEKLQQTLQTEEDQHKFAQWRDVEYLVLYDGASTEKRDAVSAMNMFKKFSNEGFSGHPYLLRGGFNAFALDCPLFIDHRSASERPGTTVTSDGGRPSFAPVIGGVTLPSGANNPNPFFSNIRQNMDLTDGVGQLDISVPSNLDASALPRWLQDVTRSSDHGKKASERFLQIERSEQTRMKEAYAFFNTSAPPTASYGGVRLSGVEQGGKNRYKDILPFEHARVHLAGRKDGACDYINASHVRASRSYKRYIASQGPLPATFEDFWSVIWDQDVRVIVMLTAESEGGQLKCHPYWQSKEFGPIRLRPLSEKKVSLDIDKHRLGSGTASSSTNNVSAESGRRRAFTTTTLESAAQNPPPQAQPEAPYVIVRKFLLSHTAHPFSPIREITQLQYASWPDFGAPAQPSHLLALVELANLMQHAALPVDASSIAASVATENPALANWLEPESDANARPMLVHCSAGCGRTGTFCTVDSVIDMLKRQRLASTNRPDVDGDVSMDGSPPNRYRGAAAAGLPAGPTVTLNGDVESSWLEDTSLDLVETTVEDFRRQRLSMVQTLRQFVLCYETVVEWIWRVQEKTRGTAGGRGRPQSEIFEPRNMAIGHE
ncbi:hypothetical protein GGS23DRAFT_616494 [Durotheca rogersii]|uniref:uncharacterized protein n=1 Tax=Durotheca rogersii TaxID=419775 RepID=UPI00221E9728|nr:uncharacterized protein GGS23DRAFT_616494 [Durotheca rogersii]KAI5858296.1 hypothetical protein GGS23DRAFT_616494 [Durotheca rogersii]